MNALSGDLQNLRASERSGLEKLLNRRSRDDRVLDNDLAKRAAKLARDLSITVGLLLERDGHVSHVVVGRKGRLYLPDLGRYRLDEARLRQLRLIVFDPRDISGKDGSPEIARDLITDLEKLRLDLVMVVQVSEHGRPAGFTLAHLQPAGSSGIAFLRGRDLNDCDLEFSEFIAQLESFFTDERRGARSTRPNGAVLVGAYTGSAEEANASMEELAELCRTAGIEVLQEVIQRRKTLDPRTVIGKGKVEELVLLCLDLGAELLIFDRELAAGQLRSITNLTELKVLDRSMLILDIFAQRAKSSEGRLQVELAQLKYSLPRLTEKDSGLSRLTGGIGGRGPGETKLEVTRRRARDRIALLEKRIAQLGQQRSLRRSYRQDRGVPVVAIVGYTNAGKSTLLNAITNSEVFVENKLFATLDPTSRRMRFPDQGEVIFVDTVGFIRELPKELVAAFRATLEEVGEADLLLHVVDISDPAMRTQLAVVRDTLEELGFGEKPRVLVLNKCDRVETYEAAQFAVLTGGIPVSALNRINFSEMINRIREKLLESFQGQDPGGFVRV